MCAFEVPSGRGVALGTKRLFLRYTGLIPLLYKENYASASFIFSESVSAKKRKCFFVNGKGFNQKKILKLCCLGVLIAMQIVLARFVVIPVGDMMRFSTSFIPVVIGARLFGPLGGMAVYGLGDLVGAIAFPTGGAFFPGYTLTAAIVGLIFGLFLKETKKEEAPLKKNLKIVLSVVCTQLVGSFLMNSFWRSFQTGTPYGAVLMTRLPQCIVSTVIQIIFMVFFLDTICKLIKKITK